MANDRPTMSDEEMRKIENVKSFLQDNDVVDSESFYEFRTELGTDDK